MGRFGQLASALALSATVASPLAAQESQGERVVLAAQTGTTEAIADCGVFVREQAELAREIGTPLERQQIISLAADCRGGQLAERIAEQKMILAALNTELAEIGLRLDDQARILDDQGRELAYIQSINGQLVIRIQETQADTAAKLAEAEAILQRLATS